MRRAAVALLLLLAQIPSEADAQATLMEVTVREGDTCRGLAARLYGDPDAYPRIHEHNPGLGRMPHRLQPGIVLRVPRPEPPARLGAVRRRVERRPPRAAAFATARRGHPLPRGTQVRTHDDASATIVFDDDAEIQIRERTLVIIWGGQLRLTQRRVTRAELESGALRSRLGELAGRRPLEVQTPSSTASLDGDGVVSVEADGTSRVANHGRRVATVEAAGTRVRLPAGTGTVVRRGERPSPPRRLLRPPSWRADRRGPVVGFVGRGATLSGGFEPVSGADRYRVEVASSPDGSEMLSTLELGGAASRFELSGLREGTVYVSIASVDAAGLEGRRSPWRAFGIRLARLVEPGGARARSDDAVPQVWPGTWLVAPRGMDCAISGDDRGEVADAEGREAPTAASGIVTLESPGRHLVRCRDRQGNESTPLPVEVFDVVVRTRSGALQRDRSTAVQIEVVAPHVPPASVLVVDAGEGFVVDRAHREGGVFSVSVWASPDAPDRATLVVSVASGASRVPLGRLTLPVRDPAGTAGLRSPSETDDFRTREPSPGERPRAVQSAFGDVMWPSALSLRDERRGGLGAWVYVAPIGAGTDPQVRLGAGARAQLPDTPVRLAFASQLDLAARPSAVGRRGDADFVASLGVGLFDGGEFGAALDLTAWFPTRPEPESLGRVRLAPSLEASWRPLPALALRTRQGALMDATETGARLWAWALGVDLAPLPWLGIGVELDASVGTFADRDGAALSIGGGIEGRWRFFEAALGARFGLTDEARALHGEWAAVLSLRLVSR